MRSKPQHVGSGNGVKGVVRRQHDDTNLRRIGKMFDRRKCIDRELRQLYTVKVGNCSDARLKEDVAGFVLIVSKLSNQTVFDD
jgi:hypothetical protein